MPQLLSASKFIPHPYEQLIAENAVLPGMSEMVYETALRRYGEMRDHVIERIWYAVDGLKVTGFRFAPVEAGEGSLPLLIFNRGGNRELGKNTINYMMSTLIPILRAFPAVMLASQYRGNDGGEGREDLGDQDVTDVLALIEIGKQDPRWDGKNIFMLGWSFGGHKTYNAIRAGAKVNAAAIGAGPVDMFTAAEARPELEQNVFAELIPGYPERREEEYRKRSAIFWAEKLDVPLLLLHGDKDWRFEPDHARRMDTRLTELGYPHKYVEFPGGDHGLLAHREQVYREIADWFGQYKR